MGLVDRRPVVCPTLAMGFWVPLHSIHSNSSPSDNNQAKNVKISSKNDDKFPRFSPELTGMQLNSSDHPFKTFVDPLNWWDPTEERAQVSFIRQQCDEEVWNEVAKNMRPRPTIRKLVDIMSVIKCGNQVDGDKISARRDAVFQDYKDDVLRGKLWKNPPIRCEKREAKIETIQGSRVQKQRPPKQMPCERLLSAISMSSVGWRAA